MNDVTTQHARLAVRASDAEREQAVALLQRSFADGRLTLAELDERVGAAYAARTRAQLRDLTADLPAADLPAADLPAAGVPAAGVPAAGVPAAGVPAAEQQPPRPGMVPDRRLLCILLCACPTAGLAYWLLSVRQTAPLQAWLRNARPRRRVLAGAIAAAAGVAVQLGRAWAGVAVFSHLAGAVLVSAGVIVALPAISGLLRRTRVTVRRAFRRTARGAR